MAGVSRGSFWGMGAASRPLSNCDCINFGGFGLRDGVGGAGYVIGELRFMVGGMLCGTKTIDLHERMHNRLL